MKLDRNMVVGFFAGLFLGMTDYLLLRALDVTMLVEGRDVTLLVVVLFAFNFGLLGAVIARLLAQRKHLAGQANLIKAQLGELRTMQGALVEKETLAAVGQMAAGVAHEVRNPLSVIRSSAQMLSGGEDPQRAEVAEFICEEVDRLNGFVGRILDFSRGVEVSRTPIAFTELLSRVRAATVTGFETAGDGVLDVDPELTARIIANLVENASNFVADDGNILVALRDGAVEVRDDGPGVGGHDSEKIFEPFFTTRARGTGLGLAMARKMARVQGLELRYLSGAGLGEGGAGACFRLELGGDV